MEINRKAPVLSKGVIEIAADPETVWKVLATIDRWPDWNPDIKSVSLDESVAKGTRFRWKAGPWKIVSVIENVKRDRVLAWTGRMMGIKAVHVWHLEPRRAGTLVMNEESWDGLVARLLRRSLQKALDKANASGLAHLKAEAERRAKPRA
ncbi:MAG TPA: SRPBCC family protein [Acidobacteriota bacterium]|nr:SRPBCC family protein [Acidobacteriota bacterium]